MNHTGVQSTDSLRQALRNRSFMSERILVGARGGVKPREATPGGASPNSSTRPVPTLDSKDAVRGSLTSTNQRSNHDRVGKSPLRIGVSQCLLGDCARYDGGHKRDSFLADTCGRYVEWVPVCPEVQIGLGTLDLPTHRHWTG
ncbi:MAG: DUF523 domain-containing protein [Nitrospirota bacterium]|nr:DUF523 domain-containing protein [Nitrospirota bacterium]